MAFKSWFPVPKTSQFSLANLPFGIVSTSEDEKARVAVAIGDSALDLAVFAAANGFSALPSVQQHLGVFSAQTLNALAALGRPLHRDVRRYLQNVFLDETPFPDILKSNTRLQKDCMLDLRRLKMHLPMQIGDYTDFFVGKNHAQNIGTIFRGPGSTLQPNYTHMPVAYHSRASSVVVSGTPIRRPTGQIVDDLVAEPKVPSLQPSRKLDFELELGAFVCKENKMGEPIPIAEAADSLFGLVLLNDWSARDIQMWESAPLGPFNAKNFGTTISPWVILMDALEPFKTQGIQNETKPLPYLAEEISNVFDIRLEVEIACK
jgi:fumarylacetoacetase